MEGYRRTIEGDEKCRSNSGFQQCIPFAQRLWQFVLDALDELVDTENRVGGVLISKLGWSLYVELPGNIYAAMFVDASWGAG